MALDVSSFPTEVHVPHDGEGAAPRRASLVIPGQAGKRRRLFGSLFGSKDGNTPSMRLPRLQEATPCTAGLLDSDERGVRADSSRSTSPVLDISAPRSSTSSRPILSISISRESKSPSPAEFVIPPTPTAPEPTNPMKESIKALKLSDLHHTVDWARKPEDEALPPWASRNIIASFGDPDEYALGEVHNKSRLSSGTTASSIGSRSNRPSVPTSPSSRTSSLYGSSTTPATSVGSPRSSKSRASQWGSIPFRRISVMSSLSAKSSRSTRSDKPHSATAPTQLSGQMTLRLRSLSAGSGSGSESAGGLTVPKLSGRRLRPRSQSDNTDGDYAASARARDAAGATGLLSDGRPRTQSNPERKGVKSSKGKTSSPSLGALPSTSQADHPASKAPPPPKGRAGRRRTKGQGGAESSAHVPVPTTVSSDHDH